MKRGLLIGGGVIGVLIIAVVVIVVFVLSSLDSLIQEAVETYGSEITQADVRLDTVKIEASSGKGALSGLKVGNPKGFETESAFRLGEVSVSLDVGTVTEDVIVINEIVIAAPEVTYEMASGGTNIDALQRNVDSYMEAKGLKSKGGKAEPAKTEAKDDGGPKLVITNLYIKGGKANVSATMLKGKTMTVPLPDIHLKDIGKDKGGASPGEVVEQVLGSVTKGVKGAVATLDLGKTMETVTEGAKGAVESVTKGASGATGAVSEGTDKATGAIKKLFGGK
jgi:hypothetical protein